MFFDRKDLLSKQTIELYNNMATSGNCTGRLQARLQVFPSPLIIWEFEALGDTACTPNEVDGKLEHPLVGSGFSITEPIVRGPLQKPIPEQTVHRVETVHGVAREACFGESSIQAHSFTFYLPNARFQIVSFEGQDIIKETVRAITGEDSRFISSGIVGHILSASIDGTWDVHLDTSGEPYKWLDPNQENGGTLITTTGHLYPSKKDSEETEQEIEAPSLSIDEALSKIGTLTALLSFANGGYLGPLYVEGSQRDGKKFKFSANILAHLTTPLEQIGTTWLTRESDLKAYIQCYPAFDQMIRVPPWNESFDLILAWYFQAIQPQNTQSRGKPWPIVANAVGAALERLCAAILVKERNIRGLKGAREKTEHLLKLIGITKRRGYDDIDYVDDFWKTRNDATHPRQNASLTNNERNEVVWRAIQWVEEALLWRLGYNGKYRDRLNQSNVPIEPRYDLSLRNPSW